MTRQFSQDSLFDTHAPRRALNAKRAQLAAHQPVTMSCREYFRHALMENGINPADFSAALHLNSNYVSRIFSETGPLPQTLVKALTILTHQRYGFWRETSFTVQPGEKVPTIDLERASELPEGLFDTKAKPLQPPVHIIAGARTQSAIRSLPRIGMEMLYDIPTQDWKHGTFLVDERGRFRDEWQDFAATMRNNPYVDATIRKWCQLPVLGEHAALKQRFVTTLVEAAVAAGKLPSTEVLQCLAVNSQGTQGTSR